MFLGLRGQLERLLYGAQRFMRRKLLQVGQAVQIGELRDDLLQFGALRWRGKLARIETFDQTVVLVGQIVGRLVVRLIRETASTALVVRRRQIA